MENAKVKVSIAQMDYSFDTSITETEKHFFGVMSRHLSPSLGEFMKENGITNTIEEDEL